MLVACSTYGTHGDDNGDAGVLDAGIDSASVSSDGGVDEDASDAGAGDAACPVSDVPGVVYAARFDTGNCDGWAGGFATVTWTSTPNRCGAGACKVCATSANAPAITRKIEVTKKDGTFELRLHALSDAYTGRLIAAMHAYDDAGAQLGSEDTQVTLVPGPWLPLQVVQPNTGTAVSISVTVYGAVDSDTKCFYVDEISLGHY